MVNINIGWSSWDAGYTQFKKTLFQYFLGQLSSLDINKSIQNDAELRQGGMVI